MGSRRSVKDRVAVVKARNSRPGGASESKSMISRWISSRLAVGCAAAMCEKVAAGAGSGDGVKAKIANDPGSVDGHG